VGHGRARPGGAFRQGPEGLFSAKREFEEFFPVILPEYGKQQWKNIIIASCRCSFTKNAEERERSAADD
jgi:hypothetical protein